MAMTCTRVCAALPEYSMHGAHMQHAVQGRVRAALALAATALSACLCTRVCGRSLSFKCGNSELAGDRRRPD